MRRHLLFTAALAGLAMLTAGDVFAHGGSFRGPNGGVPPGARDPMDPEPPPPPPSDPRPGDGPVTNPDPGKGPTPHSGGDGDGAPPAPPIGQKPKQQTRGKTAPLTFASWRFWWGYNNDDILNLKERIRGMPVSGSFIAIATKQDEENRRDPMRPARMAIERSIIPALLRTIHRAGDHEDIHGGALVALGKVGNTKHVPLFRDALWNKFTNAKGKKMDFGYQATESACLALGLLPNLDDASRATVRAICLEAIADDSLRTRERTWAAVCLGLQRDRAAVPALLELLQQRYADDNIPAGILAGLGLIGDESARAPLETILRKGRLGRRDVSDRVRSFSAYALGKIGDPASLDTCLEVVGSRRAGRSVRRSAVIAVGMLAPRASRAQQDEAVARLKKYMRKSGGDASGENFALIALSQIGTDDALMHLLDVADRGRYGQRPFAAIGLGTHVFYADRAKREVPLRKRIVERLAKLSAKYKDNDTKSAFLLARGLVKDATATEELISIASSRSKDATLRGYCCVALGLLGDAHQDVKDALELALKERRSVDLRRDAATGLSLLQDAKVVPLLLDELKRAKSFAVQGQLITAIGTIGDARAVPHLVELLDDRSQADQTRAMAAVGLGMIGDMRDLPALGRLSKNYNYRASVGDLDELLFIL